MLSQRLLILNSFITWLFAQTTRLENSLFQGGLSSPPFLTDGQTRMVSPENPTGEKGRGGMAVPNPNDPDLPYSVSSVDLGQGWKVRPFIKPQAGQTVTIMDIDGPATIQHIWMATDKDFRGNGRGSVLRFYWDGENTPSVEVPMTDFFAVGHEQFARVNSIPVVVNPTSSLNCYWPMPFRKHVKITFTNENEKDLPLMTYQITYLKAPVPDNAAYFHAQWRRAVTDRHKPVYTILDGVKGNGRYIGTFLAWTQLSDGWFGEGEVKFYMDGDSEFPTSVELVRRITLVALTVSLRPILRPITATPSLSPARTDHQSGACTGGM